MDFTIRAFIQFIIFKKEIGILIIDRDNCLPSLMFIFDIEPLKAMTLKLLIRSWPHIPNIPNC